MRKAASARASKQLAGLQLPDAVISCILQHVPLQQRLQLALVSKAWAAAAVLASNSVHITTTTPTSPQHVQRWLESCAGHLQSVSVKGPYEFCRHVLHLPCSKFTQLVSLKLHRLQLAMPSTGSIRTRSSASTSRSRALMASASKSSRSSTAQNDPLVPPDRAAAGFMPALQRLQLVNCQLSVDSMQQLTQLTGLTSLILQWPKLHADNSCRDQLGDSHPSYIKAMAGLLASLPNLSVLSLETSAKSDQVLRAISSMQHLQQLSVHGCFRAAAVFQLMPSSLTAVHLQGRAKLTAAAATQLSQLVQLQLDNLTVDPSLLYSFPGLQQLVLREVKFQPATLPWDAQSDDQQHAGNMHHVLAAVGGMTGLQHLELALMLPHHDLCLPSSDSSRFTALTTSHKLTCLQLSATHRTVLPAQALQHMLPAGTYMQQLQVLRLTAADYLELPAWAPPDDADIEAAACVDAADIGRLATCCTALQELELRNALRDAAAASSLQQLTQLTALTCLDIMGLGCHDTAAAAVAQLTGLRDLRFERSHSIHLQGLVTVSGLQQLTALRCLTQLYLGGWRYVDWSTRSIMPASTDITGDLDHILGFGLTASQKDHVPTDVWQQLERLCQASLDAP